MNIAVMKETHPGETRVPMVLWMSERFRDSLALDAGCFSAGAADPE